ncbi:MAG: dihydroorotase [Clostridiaceae bacterium]
MNNRMIIKNAKRILTGNTLEDCEILIDGEKILEVSAAVNSLPGDIILDAKGMLITPGFIDVHVHLREPGFEYKETIRTGTRAGALGGYTTLFAMPNTKPNPDNRETLEMLQMKSKEDGLIRCEFYSTITKGEKGAELVDFGSQKEAGAIGFSDDGKGVQDAGQMYKAMLAVKEVDGFIAAHCEDESMLFGGYVHEGEYSKANGHQGINSLSEDLQIIRDAAISEATGCKYHICHMSTKRGVRALKRAKEDGIRISGEVTPHHLLLNEWDLTEDGNYKMNPPLRGKEDQEALIKGLNEVTIDIIATDHAPHSLEEKEKGLKGSAFGIVGLETSFPLLYTELVLKEKMTLERLVEAMTSGVMKLFNLQYGALESGKMADITLIDLNKEWSIDKEKFESKGKNTPFDGYKVKGKVDTVIFGGKIVVREGEIIG